MSFNIAMLLQESARRDPQKTAIILDHIHVSYQQLDQASRTFASALAQLGVNKGDRVMLMIPNLPEFPICFFGIGHIGAVSVPVNVLYKEREISFRLKDSKSKILVVWEDFLEEALKSHQAVDSCEQLIVIRRKERNISPSDTNLIDFQKVMAAARGSLDMQFTGADDPAVILYTSGTTGVPKGAVLSHFSIFYQSAYAPLSGRGKKEEREIIGIAHLPFFHVYGLFNVLCATISLGGTITLLPRYEPGKVLQVIERDKVTDFNGVPTMYNRLYYHPDFKNRDLSSLFFCGCGGAPLPVELAEAWEAATGVIIEEGYGMTETGSGVSTNAVDQVEAKIGSAGKPMWGNEIKIVDTEGQPLPQGELGEVVCRGPGMMNGYFNRPEANASSFRNGWLNTGDIGYLDEEGYLFLVDRKKEMIIRGGFNVYPRQIEEILYEHPAVQECAVIGVPHDDLGEEVKAVLYLKAGSSCSEDEIRTFCKERMAAFKYPRIVEILEEELPKSATGKILKRQLKSSS
ncbi:MAG: long-chain fatty acid--CoA ligase [Bacteroidota bacterium]